MSVAAEIKHILILLLEQMVNESVNTTLYIQYIHSGGQND